jgi:hypothetical protein
MSAKKPTPAKKAESAAKPTAKKTTTKRTSKESAEPLMVYKE